MANAMKDNTTGDYNTSLGNSSLPNNTTGGYNVAIGYISGLGNVTGNYNVHIGYGSGFAPTFTNLQNTIAIGNGAQVGSSNHARIGNSSITVIGGYAPWTNLSDARFKKNVREDVPGLEFIKKLRPVTFYWDMDKLHAFEKSEARIEDWSKAKQKYTGFLAQEVESAAKQAKFDFSGVIKPANDAETYQLSYADFVVPLVKSVQEQQREIDSLKATIAAMPGQPGAAPWRDLFVGLVAALAGAGFAFVYSKRAVRTPAVARRVATALAHD